MIISADLVVTGAHVHHRAWVEVRDGLVAGVGTGEPPTPVDQDLGDAVLVPGFVDMHSHGGGGGTFSDPTPESVDVALALHRRHGTTTSLASLVSEQPTPLLRQVAALAELAEDGAIAGIHLEGPWLSPHRCGAHEPSALRDPTAAEIDALLAAGRGAVRMVTLAPELPGALDAVRRLADAGVVVAIGHTDATFEQARRAIDAGARVATHLFNAMRPVHHREPGPVIACLDDPRVTMEMIADGVHLHPALYRDVATRSGADRVALVTDAMAAAGMPDGDYRLGTLGVEVTEGVAHVAGSDTIAGSTATMDRLFGFAVHHLGVDREAALLSAVRQTSLNPARALGLAEVGLTPGARADLVALDPDLRVRAVMRAGAWLSP